jgi:hypothetical protein
LESVEPVQLTETVLPLAFADTFVGAFSVAAVAEASPEPPAVQ